MESPIPDREFDRLLQLLDYDMDSSGLESSLKDLTKLAAKVAGTSISLVNLIDSYTQWSVAAEGLSIVQMPREDSVCQYTIKCGSFRMDSKLGEYSRFEVSLPL